MNSNQHTTATHASHSNLDHLGLPPGELTNIASNMGSLLDFAAEATPEAPSLVRLNENETAVVPFTSDYEDAHIHYSDAPEVSSYVVCNGADCTLCQIGNKADRRLLNPVYLPTTGDIGVVAISPLMRPHALLPQYLPHLSKPERMALFIQRQGSKYRVTARPLRDDEDDGRAVVESFMKRWRAGAFRLADVYAHLDNAALLTIPSIARMAQLKGIAS